MQDSNAPLSDEVLMQALREHKHVADLSALIQEEVEKELNLQLTQFKSAIAQSNAATVEIMALELNKLKNESATVAGVLSRLKAVATPDLLDIDEDVISYQQAINNLKTYGSIIPSSADIIAHKLQAQKNHAWSLFWQSLIQWSFRILERKISATRATS